MKKLLLLAALASLALLTDGQLASARRGGCGGGGRRGHHGGCGGGGGCGMMMGGCGGGGGCGMMMGGCGMGHGGYVMGGGSYAIGGGTALVQATGTEATLIVSLPEDATLTIDGEETISTSAQRVFVTPSLEEGKEYEYTLKAKVVRDGKTQIATAKVTFRPGETKQVELKVPAVGVAAQ